LGEIEPLTSEASIVGTVSERRPAGFLDT
jgi:hypothetical protein